MQEKLSCCLLQIQMVINCFYGLACANISKERPIRPISYKFSSSLCFVLYLFLDYFGDNWKILDTLVIIVLSGWILCAWNCCFYLQEIIRKYTEISGSGNKHAALASAQGFLTWEKPLYSEFQQLARYSSFSFWLKEKTFDHEIIQLDVQKKFYNHLNTKRMS